MVCPSTFTTSTKILLLGTKKGVPASRNPFLPPENPVGNCDTLKYSESSEVSSIKTSYDANF